MCISGQEIQHKVFGGGIVTDYTGGIITVRFPQGDKKFLCPQAFSQFLSFKNPEAQREIDKLLERERKAAREKNAAALREQKKAKLMRSLKVSANSQAVFDIKQEAVDGVFRDWTLSCGHYKTGAHKGSPRTPDRLKPNSACLLTEKPEGAAERDRRILGVFMVEDNFFGYLCTDGIIKANAKYRIKLKAEDNFRFWDYFPEEERLSRWNGGCFKYFTNAIMLRIISDISENLTGEENRTAAAELRGYFRAINKLK